MTRSIIIVLAVAVSIGGPSKVNAQQTDPLPLDVAGSTGIELDDVSTYGGAGTSVYSGRDADSMRDDADQKISTMRVAVDEVRAMRDGAQESGDVSGYQRLNNLYTQMNSRLLIAEQAREGMGVTATGQEPDRNALESEMGLIDAAYTSVMASRDEAQRVVTGGVTGGDSESVVGGANGLPDYDTTTTGGSVSPDGSEDGRENSAFGRGTPFS